MQSPSPSSARHYVVKRINQYSVPFHDALPPHPVGIPAGSPDDVLPRTPKRPRLRRERRVSRRDGNERDGTTTNTGRGPLDSSGRGRSAAQVGTDQRLQPPSFSIALLHRPPTPSLPSPFVRVSSTTSALVYTYLRAAKSLSLHLTAGT